MKKTEIKFTISLDENKLPVAIQWEATDNQEKGECKSVLLSLWDSAENNTLRIDLWTKDMKVDDMKHFFYQSLISMADTFQRATGEEEMVKDMKDFCHYFAEKMKLNPPPGQLKTDQPA